jgi:hypothetical protein
VGFKYFGGFQGGIQISRVVMNITNNGSAAGISINNSSNSSLDIIESTINVQTLQFGGNSNGTILRTNIIGTTTSGTVLTQNSKSVQLDYVAIRKTGTQAVLVWHMVTIFNELKVQLYITM